MVLLGPSGCGKTTTLNMIAGMDTPTSGHILFDGAPVEHVPPEKRNIAMVFQTIALYPHKTVYENIAFPLRMGKVPRGEIDGRVRGAASLMRIQDLLNRRPHELSGGQRQRVALGRAAVRNPLVFLFDEPLSALDAKLRAEMRIEIKKLHERLGSTFIYVTHDQVEALTMADRIAVMDGGRLKQYATPDEIYRRPANTTVARFVGSPSMNLITGRPVEVGGRWVLQGSAVSVPLADELLAAARTRRGDLTLGVRPEGLTTEETGVPLHGASRIYATEPLGSDQFLDVTFDARAVRRSGPDQGPDAPRHPLPGRGSDRAQRPARRNLSVRRHGGADLPLGPRTMTAAPLSLGRADSRFALKIVLGLIAFNAVIIVLPLIYAAWISAHETDVILQSEEFVGWAHYTQILSDPEAINAILLSLKFTAVAVVASFGIGLGIALVLNEEFPGRRLLRAAILLPWAISEVVTATAWLFIVNPTFGVLTGTLHQLGLVKDNTNFLNENTALYWVAMAFVWHIAPLGAFFFLAALQTIPESLYQAARMDRATAVQRFFHVTLPHLRSIMMIVLVVVTVEAFRSFDIVFAMTHGGPGTATQIFPMLIYRYMFEFSQYGLAAAASYVLVAIGMVITTLYFVILMRRQRVVRIEADSKPIAGPAVVTEAALS